MLQSYEILIKWGIISWETILGNMHLIAHFIYDVVIDSANKSDKWPISSTTPIYRKSRSDNAKQ